jgi:hypothetical protein
MYPSKGFKISHRLIPQSVLLKEHDLSEFIQPKLEVQKPMEVARITAVRPAYQPVVN